MAVGRQPALTTCCCCWCGGWLLGLVRYDRFGEAGVDGRGGFGGAQFVDDFDIGDIFDTFFGGGAGEEQQGAGQA